ncbi:MAG: helix-turn-helix transcriptional regulator [Kangiellaceae bacterium]|nr:helix-turn-helix transcriptional regulator [Kangiellaceae bacterium]MCW8998721.1 helix-turn-helix transcriptional regulator [Kangiellaceae bacterium]MCW9016527.1 helix-turn-helix transcriptional regulator [Kangiellaceae bacterium]
MAQTTLFLQAVKACLKNKGLTYADVATQLSLSEASVKRIFSEENISLQRLDQICQMMNMELCDLARIAEQKQHEIQELTEEQEAEFVKQPKLLFVAYMLLNDFTFEEIKCHYNIDEHEGIQLLAHLDRIKFIDLLPGNRVKLLTSRNFRWRKNGAIEKLFNETIRKEFFHSRFAKQDECMKFSGGMVSRSTILLMHKKIERLIGDFNELAQQDASLPFEERIGCSLVGAIRPWEFSLFAQYRKPPEK